MCVCNRLSGSGFHPDATQNVVTVGGQPVPVLFSSPTELIVATPNFQSEAISDSVSTICSNLDLGSSPVSPGAGIGSIALGPRGALLQLWNSSGVNLFDMPT